MRLLLASLVLVLGLMGCGWGERDCERITKMVINQCPAGDAGCVAAYEPLLAYNCERGE